MKHAKPKGKWTAKVPQKLSLLRYALSRKRVATPESSIYSKPAGKQVLKEKEDVP